MIQEWEHLPASRFAIQTERFTIDEISLRMILGERAIGISYSILNSRAISGHRGHEQWDRVGRG